MTRTWGEERAFIAYMVGHTSSLLSSPRQAQETPLLLACQGTEENIVKLLVEKSADCNQSSQVFACIPRACGAFRLHTVCLSDLPHLPKFPSIRVGSNL
jgi:hypothetical protein